MPFKKSSTIDWIKSIVNSIINIGVNQSLSMEESRVVMIHNTLSLFSNLLLSYFPIVFIWLNMKEGLILCLLSFITTMIPFVFNHFQKFIISRYFALLSAVSIFILGIFMYGIKSGFLFGIMAILVLPILYFRQIKHRLIFYLCVLIMAGISFYYFPTIRNYFGNNQSHPYFYPILFISFLILIITYFIAVNSINKLYQQKNLQLLTTLKNRNKELKAFSYSVTHDLKQPIKNIQNFSNLLALKEKDISAEEKSIFISFIQKSSNKLDDMLDGMYNHSIIGQSEVPTTFDVQELIKEEIAKLDQLISNHQTTIVLEAFPFSIFAKKEGIGQVFKNLIANAIRFKSSKRLPSIQITGLDRKNYWEFSVKDNGIGIAAVFQNKIFNMFQKGHNEQERSGVGIGLANCKKIIEQHQGEIWVESVEGLGSTFSFTIKKEIN